MMYSIDMIKLSRRLEARLMGLAPTSHWYLQVWRHNHARWVMAIG